MTKRYFIQLSYNGSSHSGWQRQKNAPSIQEDIEAALETILRLENIRITGCGRTDTGVHAKHYYAHLDVALPEELDLVYRLNQLLDSNIAVLKLVAVDAASHARFDAERREYQYKIHFHKDPFSDIDSALLKRKPDIDKMNQAAALLIGTQDFTSFAKVDNDANHHICDLFEAAWVQEDGGMVFTIAANRFLRNMVRAIVGTLLEVGYGKRSVADFKEVISVKDRNKAGTSAPAKGLSLTYIHYPFKL